jgi:hypothetical protein
MDLYQDRYCFFNFNYYFIILIIKGLLNLILIEYF